MSGSSVPVGLAYLRSELRAAQRRSVLLGIANAALVALFVALGLFCFLRVLVLLWPSVLAFRLEWAAPSGFLSGLRETPAGHVVVTALIGVAAFVVAGTLAFAGRPKIETLARRGDRTFALSERLSTAIEVERRSVRDSVSNALLGDVADRAGAVGRRALVPFRVPPLAGAVIILAVAAVVLPNPGLLTLAGAAVRGTAAAPTLDVAERADVAEDLRRVAALVAADAERRSDPYLAAIARELETVAEAVTVDPTLDRQGVADALRRLVPYANEAYGAGAVAGAVPTNLAPLIEAAANAVETTGRAVPRPVLPGIGETQQAAAGPATGPNEPSRTETLDRMLGALERLDGAIDLAAMTPPMPGGDVAGIAEESYAAPWALPGEALLEGVLGARPGGQLDAGVPGAAPVAGIGEGDAVGAGTRPLENGTLTEFGALPQPTTEMMLADTTEGNGRRIRLEAAPPAIAGEMLPGADLAAGTGWRPIPESPVSRNFLPIGLGHLLSRYFVAADPNQ